MKTSFFNVLHVVFILIFLVSCSTPRIVYDYDKEVNFNQYKTFDLYPDMQINLTELDSSRVVYELDSILMAKGFNRSQSPDVYINVYTQQYETPGNTNIGIGVGGTGRNVGFGISGGIPLQPNNLIMNITVDMVDATKNTQVWQGVYEGKIKTNMDPYQKSAYFRDVFTGIFDGYPPK